MVGATDLRDILAKLLTPMAVAVSSGSTMPVAKDWRMGMVNMSTVLWATMRKTARGNQAVWENAMVMTPAMMRDATREGMSPNLSTTRGMNM